MTFGLVLAIWLHADKSFQILGRGGGGAKGGQTALLPPLPLGFARAMEWGASFPTLLRLALNPMIYFTPSMLASPTSSGTFSALGFSAPVIGHEKDMSQGATDPARLKPHGEELVRLPNWSETHQCITCNRAAPHTYKP